MICFGKLDHRQRHEIYLVLQIFQSLPGGNLKLDKYFCKMWSNSTPVISQSIYLYVHIFLYSYPRPFPDVQGRDFIITQGSTKMNV